MGSEILGQMLMAQLSGGDIILPSWNTICPNKNDWIDIPRDKTTTKECIEV